MAKKPGWSNAELWQSLRDGSGCPICQKGHPLDVIAESDAIWVTAGREAPLPGYACVVSKRHVVEPHELPAREGRVFWEDAMTTARVLNQLFRPIKMNYEIHGNVIPHLHLHLYPRFEDDPYAIGPIASSPGVFTRSDEALTQMADALCSAL